MKFKTVKQNVAQSDCGRYEIRAASLDGTARAKKFYNAWFIPDGKHIDASFDKKLVIAACITHAENA